MMSETTVEILQSELSPSAKRATAFLSALATTNPDQYRKLEREYDDYYAQTHDSAIFSWLRFLQGARYDIEAAQKNPNRMTKRRARDTRIDGVIFLVESVVTDTSISSDEQLKIGPAILNTIASIEGVPRSRRTNKRLAAASRVGGADEYARVLAVTVLENEVSVIPVGLSLEVPPQLGAADTALEAQHLLSIANGSM